MFSDVVFRVAAIEAAHTVFREQLLRTILLQPDALEEFLMEIGFKVVAVESVSFIHYFGTFVKGYALIPFAMPVRKATNVQLHQWQNSLLNENCKEEL